ncbi:alpha-amylase family glycosyl hydrolase [Buchananella felis]|uniref:alpha-amylase family glycosyl hydrolase n=1 Tax=Buchananella felis TaxID=3231492 RepID=UPI003528D3A6
MTFPSYVPLNESAWERAEWPLGGHLTPTGATFAVYAPKASRVQLEFYQEHTGQDAHFTCLPAQGPDGVWRAEVGGVEPGVLYGYRTWGGNWPYDPQWRPGSEAGFLSDFDAFGNRFNPNKVLFDPYGREVTHTMYSDCVLLDGLDGGAFGTGGEDYLGRPRREADTARIAPKSVLLPAEKRDWQKPSLPAGKAVIYESSISQLVGHPSVARLGDLLGGAGGFAQLQNVPPEYVGTYKGAAMLAPYLKALGITALELLPVHETNVSESGRDGHTNSWGYMTLSFFSPSRRYAADKSFGGPTREFREMVTAFHREGIEVYLDVVYNHTAEGGNWNGDPTTTGFTSLGGFAAGEYYVQTASHAIVDGATGTSNQLNYSSPAAHRLVLDSLAYWTREMGVDGFRFDLATVLGRRPADAHQEDWGNQKRFFSDHELLVEIAAFAKAENIEVIAEAWDLWGYEVGNFPRGWGEWNGRYRDTVRRFLKGDGNTGAFLEMVNGDYHHFADNGGPQRTVNFVVAHDGFTLADLVSYPAKQNDQPWPFGPSDGGSDDNLSWDSGGDQALRRQRLRNFLVTLFFSRGVPMIVAGDEFGRTQNGNNNPWALSSIAMWNNYAAAASSAPQRVPVEAIGPDGEPVGQYHDNLGQFGGEPNRNALLDFTTFLGALRSRHDALCAQHYGDLRPDDKDVSYVFHSPEMLAGVHEGDRAVAIHINTPGDDFWLMVNMADFPINFRVPQAAEGQVWRKLVDTSAEAEEEGNFWEEGTGPLVGQEVWVGTWAIQVLHQEQA